MAGAANVAPTAGTPAGQGTAASTGTFTGSALTFSATVRYAAYLNTNNTYDFYFQVTHNGAGSTGANQAIESISVSSYGGFSVDAYAQALDPDGAGFFTAANNPTPAGGSSTGVNLSANGQVVRFDFAAFPNTAGAFNDLVQGETSATDIIRTSATNFNAIGTFGLIDGSTLSGLTFQPTCRSRRPGLCCWSASAWSAPPRAARPGSPPSRPEPYAISEKGRPAGRPFFVLAQSVPRRRPAPSGKAVE